jgi:hypothetical protein
MRQIYIESPAFYEACGKINELKISAGIVSKVDCLDQLYILVQQTEFEPPSFFGNHISSTDHLINQISQTHFRAVELRFMKFFFRHVKSDFYEEGEKLYLDDFFGNVDFHEVTLSEKIIKNPLKLLWKNLEIETGKLLISTGIKAATLEDSAILSELFKIELKDPKSKGIWGD